MEEEKREELSDISNLFGAKQMHKNNCLKCCAEVNKESVVLACNLVRKTCETKLRFNECFEILGLSHQRARKGRVELL